MVGSAVLVMLPSRAESRRGMQMAMKERQKPRPLFHFCDGISPGGEGGSVAWLSFALEKLDCELLPEVELASVPVDGQVHEDADEDGEACSG